VKYYMVQMHYDNPNRIPNRSDSTGVRFYFGKEHRRYELGYLGLGTEANANSVAIPPGANRFIVDSYCTANATKLIPDSGITVLGALPHTHLQGRSLWTKIIREKKAVDYLFNAEAFDFNYQFGNAFPKPIQLYPGDELATQCVYSTTNKNEITLGGESTREEMCMHTFYYYPRMNNLYICYTRNADDAWKKKMNSSSFSGGALTNWLLGLTWTSESISEWQEFYNNASRALTYGHAGEWNGQYLAELPKYEDLKPSECKRVMHS